MWTNTKETSFCTTTGRFKHLITKILTFKMMKSEDDDCNFDNDDDIAQEIMMLLIGESSMSNAHLVNGAVVNVRARVSLFYLS